ncbi:hypothetical protein K7432_008174 [Basidiobolus ranarum]|uniref:Uncharacterized protein n=1 Tax=Basidiobolus ranarum TaxID=34480 RepID=A0ABR2WS61_9FUNG
MAALSRPSGEGDATGKSSKLISKAFRLSSHHGQNKRKSAKFKPPPLTRDNLEVHKKLLPPSSETKLDRVTRYVMHQASIQEELTNTTNYLALPLIESLEEKSVTDQHHIKSISIIGAQSKPKVRQLFAKMFIGFKSIISKPESISFHAHPEPVL